MLMEGHAVPMSLTGRRAHPVSSAIGMGLACRRPLPIVALAVRWQHE
jgi:hypothetical protein